jgi:asparagine synthase (glutamine-hydrolysing)
VLNHQTKTFNQKTLSRMPVQCHAEFMTRLSTDTPVSSGIYALVNLDGAPVVDADARALGLPFGPAPQSWLVAGHDAYLPDVVCSHHSDTGFTLIVGEIDEAHALCDQLGLQRDTPLAALSQAALHRFGGDLPAELTGEWSLFHLATNGRITLMQSAAQRDRLFYAISGRKLAIAPNLFALTKLSWVSKKIDTAGLLFPLGRAKVRAGRNDTTMLESASQIGAACSVTIDPDGRIIKNRATVLTEQPRWHGSYADAVAEAEDTLRDIMRKKLSRRDVVTPLLSGGLDSSILSWLCTEAKANDTRLLALTSASPPDSEIADEQEFANLVARTLGMEIAPVFPSFEVNIYRPPDAILVGGSGPILSNRHCLTNALQLAAQAAGARLIIDGTYGELSVTARIPSADPLGRLRAMATRVARSAGYRGGKTIPLSPFHVRVAPHIMDNLPAPIFAAHSTPLPGSNWPPKNGLFGYLRGAEKALSLPNEFYPGAVRMYHPYRNIRLLRLFAGLPLQMLAANGADRGVGRFMLDGHLPDAIRLRRRGMPASPDHLLRLHRQAEAARLRIAEFRNAEIDEWVDLDWLDNSLASISAKVPTNFGQADEVQLTAMAAEFLLWWRKHGSI